MNDIAETIGLSRAVGDLLIQRGKLDAPGLERALRLQSETGERVDLLLTKLGQVSERDMADALSTQLKLQIVENCDYPSEPVLPDHLSAKFLQEFRVLPLSDSSAGIVLAMADPVQLGEVLAAVISGGRAKTRITIAWTPLPGVTSR